MNQNVEEPVGEIPRDAGMATAEYAMATLAACGFAALLIAMRRSGSAGWDWCQVPSASQVVAVVTLVPQCGQVTPASRCPAGRVRRRAAPSRGAQRATVSARLSRSSP